MVDCSHNGIARQLPNWMTCGVCSYLLVGSASSIRPELTGLTIALEDNEDMNILKDCLSFMLLLRQSAERLSTVAIQAPA